jgi:hypothetical protein
LGETQQRHGWELERGKEYEVSRGMIAFVHLVVTFWARRGAGRGFLRGVSELGYKLDQIRKSIVASTLRGETCLSLDVSQLLFHTTAHRHIGVRIVPLWARFCTIA